MMIEPSLPLADFRRKHGVSNSKCHREIKLGRLKTVRGADGRQRVLQSDEYRWLFGRKPLAAVNHNARTQQRAVAETGGVSQ